MGKKSKKYGMDAGYMDMISSNYSAPSNLPQEVVHKQYPAMDYFDGYYLDDSYKGIDENAKDNIRKIEQNQSDSMY